MSFPSQPLCSFLRARACAIASTFLIAIVITAPAIAYPQNDFPIAATRSRSTTATQCADINTTWYSGADNVSARDVGCSFDNGAPLDDEGHPASQLSNSLGSWNFISASADDFTLTGGTPGMNCHITTIRAAFRFLFAGSESATPRTTFTGVYVTIYPDAANSPAGQPTISGSQTGSVVASRFIPASSLLNETLVGSCSALYQVDIPVDIVVQKSVKYWLSLVPKFNGPPECFWALSQTAVTSDSVAVQGFSAPVNIPFWTPIDGNNEVCPGAPTAGSRQNLSFKITADETAPVSGACCTDNPVSCSDAIQQINCQLVNQRFSSSQTCATLSPPCGAGTGACCLPDGICQNLDPGQCASQGGNWSASPCVGGTCPPVNGKCANAILVSSGITAFNTTGAVTDGPTDALSPPCTTVKQDIWFKYQSDCAGTVFVSLCDAGTNYDSAIAVFQGWACSPLGLRLACNDDGCGTASKLSFTATNGGQYLIQVGGKNGATGSGVMTITCIPTGSGACCNVDHTCSILTQSTCQAGGGIFTANQPCSAATCPPPANDLCSNAILVTDGAHHFDTRGAGVDGPPEAGCPVEPDIWFTYTPTCNGTLHVSLCEDTNYDASLAVYQGCGCGISLGTLLGCDNDGCGTPGGPAKLAITNVTSNTCYLIRVGGNGIAGAGTIRIGCVPPGMGACCHTNQTCEITTQALCMASGDIFTPDDICSPAVCIAPQGAPCLGDLNGDCRINGIDISLFVDVWLGRQSPSIHVCRADLNSDIAENDTDIQLFVAKLLDSSACHCCRGDMNGDNSINDQDVQMLANAILAPPLPCEASFWIADVNGDDVIDGLDIRAFVNAILANTTCP